MKFDEVSYELGRQASGGGGGGSAVIESITITENGTTTAPSGVDGFAPITVAVPIPTPTLQDKSITVNGTYTADSGYDGLGEVVVAVPGGASKYDFTGDIRYLCASPAAVIWHDNGANVGSFTAITGLSNAFDSCDFSKYSSDNTLTIVLEDNTSGINATYAFYWLTGIDKVVFQGATSGISTGRTFEGSYVKEIDMSALSYLSGTTNYSSDSYFRNCSWLEKLSLPSEIYIPKNVKGNILNNCSELTDIIVPNGFQISYDPSGTYQLQSNFSNCTKLRSLPSALVEELFKVPFSTTNSGYTTYAGFAAYCYGLDEIKNLPVVDGARSLNDLARKNEHLKSLTFESNKTADWDGLTLSLTDHIGWGLEAGSVFDDAKKIIDAASYALLKNDPDAWTSMVEYSRYDHDSAVETINSLPTLDTANNHSCTISFNGTSGANTDAGAINTMTAEEIAVASAKGWTVSMT